jgi:antitoxin (DNA-binding transcriptional repressor) of toxin-antitoxin stability system
LIKTVAVHKAKTYLSRLDVEVEAGEDVVIQSGLLARRAAICPRETR